MCPTRTTCRSVSLMLSAPCVPRGHWVRPCATRRQLRPLTGGRRARLGDVRIDERQEDQEQVVRLLAGPQLRQLAPQPQRARGRREGQARQRARASARSSALTTLCGVCTDLASVQYALDSMTRGACELNRIAGGCLSASLGQRPCLAESGLVDGTPGLRDGDAAQPCQGLQLRRRVKHGHRRRARQQAWKPCPGWSALHARDKRDVCRSCCSCQGQVLFTTIILRCNQLAERLRTFL